MMELELELKGWLQKVEKEGLTGDAARKEAVRRAIEAAVHLHPDRDAKALAAAVSRALAKESTLLGDIDEEKLHEAFETLIAAIQRPKEESIEKLMAEIERLKRQLASEEEELQRNLRAIFAGIEAGTEALESQEQKVWREALESTELEHVEGLGILTETVESALVAALEEESEDLEPAVRELIRHITHKALGEGLLSAPRIRTIVTAILTEAADLAEATPTRAREILHGTVEGINDALIAIVSQLKEQLGFAPEELQSGYVVSWQELIRMLSRSDELYKEIIDTVAAKSSPFIREILQESATMPGNRFAELRRISTETIDVAGKTLADLAKEAAVRGAELKEQLTAEAKKLGEKAWKKAMGIYKK